MSKNPYLLSAAQIRRWADTHNDEAWLLLLRMLEGQNSFFMGKRGEETAQLIRGLNEQLAKGGIPKTREEQLRKVLAKVEDVAGDIQNEHQNLKQQLSGLSGSVKQLEGKLEQLRKLQARNLDLDSKLVKDLQRAKEAARKREQDAQRAGKMLVEEAGSHSDKGPA